MRTQVPQWCLLELRFEPREVEADQALGHSCTHRVPHQLSHRHTEGGSVQEVCTRWALDDVPVCLPGDSIVGTSLLGCNEPPQMLGPERKVPLFGAPSKSQPERLQSGHEAPFQVPTPLFSEGGKEKRCFAGWSFHSWSKHSRMIYRSGQQEDEAGWLGHGGWVCSGGRWGSRSAGRLPMFRAHPGAQSQSLKYP